MSRTWLTHSGSGAAPSTTSSIFTGLVNQYLTNVGSGKTPATTTYTPLLTGRLTNATAANAAGYTSTAQDVSGGWGGA